MTKCTEPERWKTAPGADAPEEEVESYLAHVGVCPFHADIERREEERVRGLASLARRDLGALVAEAQAAATARGDRLDARAARRHGSSGRTLSVRVNGVERARLDLTSHRPLTLEVEAGALVALWQTGRDGVDDEGYLTSYLLPAGGGAAGAQQVSEKVLASGDRIIFTTEARAGGGMQLTVACDASGGPRARRLSAARRASRASDEPARALRRQTVRRLAVVLCALAAVVLLALALLRPTEQPAPVVRQEQPTRTPAADASPTPEATPPVNNTQSRQDVAPPARPNGQTPTPSATPRTSQGGGRVSPSTRSREQLTVADVRRIYVGAGEGTYDTQLREALIERLRAGDRFIVVTGEQQADAVLLREQSRSAGVSVQLVTRGGKTLWFTTQPAAAGGGGDVGDLAAKIVAALTAAGGGRTPVTAPPR